MRDRVKDPLARAIDRVVRNDLCTGCGACAALFERIEMRPDKGFLRPVVAGPRNGREPSQEAARFERVCPGLGLKREPVEDGLHEHDVFGRYVSVWRGWAGDPSTRLSGSSGGVLSALAGLIASDRPQSHVVAVREDSSVDMFASTVRLTGADHPSSIAGSRYSPVAALEHLDLEDPPAAVIGKPCEIAALRTIQRDGGLADSTIRLSFFCAGTSRWTATLQVLEDIGMQRSETAALRYRGNGWPGPFRAVTTAGQAHELSYGRAWGEFLGRDVQLRCKLCIDGTGEFADIAVGDFWQTDERGYPAFTENEGESVVIARTARGDGLLRRARAAGVLTLEALDMESIVPVQPLQVERRGTIGARLLGRRLAGFRPPNYSGWNRLLVGRVGWRKLPRVVLGTFARSFGLRRRV